MGSLKQSVKTLSHNLKEPCFLAVGIKLVLNLSKLCIVRDISGHRSACENNANMTLKTVKYSRCFVLDWMAYLINISAAPLPVISGDYIFFLSLMMYAIAQLYHFFINQHYKNYMCLLFLFILIHILCLQGPVILVIFL